MKYKVGDRVRIVDHCTRGMNSNGEMDRWLRKTMTIARVEFLGYRMVEDKGRWIWYTGEIAGLAGEEFSTETINIEIDPTDPKSAHAAVDTAIKARKENKRDWTDAEIEQAKELSRELVVKLFDAGCSVVWYDEIGIAVRALSAFGNTDRYPSIKLGAKHNGFRTVPHGKDVFNEHIGKCVCLCKLTNTPIPDFICNKNKEKK